MRLVVRGHFLLVSSGQGRPARPARQKKRSSLIIASLSVPSRSSWSGLPAQGLSFWRQNDSRLKCVAAGEIMAFFPPKARQQRLLRLMLLLLLLLLLLILLGKCRKTAVAQARPERNDRPSEQPSDHGSLQGNRPQTNQQTNRPRKLRSNQVIQEATK